ncbi:MAG: Crp/Fnr family transcriptional regulator [Paracoccaceae bacterium]
MNIPAFNNKDCGSCPIRHQAVCSRCEQDELAVLDSIKFYRSFEAGQPVIWAGDPLDFVASVVVGVASLSQTMEDGRVQVTGLLLPSDFLGWPGRSAAVYDVTAVSDLTLCCFRRHPFEELLESTPNIGQRLLQMTMDELDAARDWMVVLGRKTAREKIASLITIFVRREAHLQKVETPDGTSFDLPLTREAMANYLGLTLETVSRQISALKRDKVILLKSKRRIMVPDFSKLLVESGD